MLKGSNARKIRTKTYPIDGSLRVSNPAGALDTLSEEKPVH